jgi:hypothetical protein
MYQNFSAHVMNHDMNHDMNNDMNHDYYAPQKQNYSNDPRDVIHNDYYVPPPKSRQNTKQNNYDKINQMEYTDLVELLLTPISPETRGIILEKLFEMNELLIKKNKPVQLPKQSPKETTFIYGSPQVESSYRTTTTKPSLEEFIESRTRFDRERLDNSKYDVSRSSAISHRKKDLVDAGFPFDNVPSMKREDPMNVNFNEKFDKRYKETVTDRPLRQVSDNGNMHTIRGYSDPVGPTGLNWQEPSIDATKTESMDDKLKRLSMLNKKVNEKKRS